MLLCRLQTLEMHFPVADSDALACHLNLPRCTCSLDLCSLVNSILDAANVSVFNRTHLNYETILKPSDRRQIRQNLHFFGQQLACNIFFSVLPPLSTVLFFWAGVSCCGGESTPNVLWSPSGLPLLMQG